MPEEVSGYFPYRANEVSGLREQVDRTANNSPRAEATDKDTTIRALMLSRKEFCDGIRRNS